MKWFDGLFVVLIALGVLTVGPYIISLNFSSTQVVNEHQILLAWIAAVVGIITAYIVLRQMLINSRNRRVDENWKRSEAARDMLDTMFHDSEAYGALRMIEDEPKEVFEYEKKNFPVTLKNVHQALEDWEDGSERSRLIRRNFDSLAFYLVRLNYFIRDGLVSLEVIRPLLRYHAMRLGQVKIPVSRYFRRICHVGAIEFLKNFDEWNRPDSYGPVDMLPCD